MMFLRSPRHRWYARRTRIIAATANVTVGAIADGSIGGAISTRFASAAIIVSATAAAVTKFVSRSASGGIVVTAGATGYASITSPIGLAGLEMWLDGSDASTVTESGGVTAWNDKSGNAHHTAWTGATKPSYGEQLNALNAVYFNPLPAAGGGLKALEVNTTGITGVTLFCVSKSRYAGAGTPIPLTTAGRLGTIEADAFNRLRYGVYTSAYTTAFIDAPDSREWAIMVMRSNFAAGGTIIRRHMEQIVSSSFPSIYVPDRDEDVSPLQIVAAASGGGFLHVAEFIVYNRVLLDAEVVAVEQYLDAKWAPQDQVLIRTAAAAITVTATADGEVLVESLITLSATSTTPALGSLRKMFRPAASAVAAGTGPYNPFANDTTRWATGAPKVPNQWYQTKMLAEFPVSAFRIYTSDANNFPKGLKVYSTSDLAKFGTATWADWTERANIAAEDCSVDMTVTFAAETFHRVFAFVQQGTDGIYWWGIHSLVPTYRGQDYTATGHALISEAGKAAWTATANKASATAINGVLIAGTWNAGTWMANNDWLMVDLSEEYEISELEFFPNINNWPTEYLIYYTTDAAATHDSGTFSSWTAIPAGRVGTGGAASDWPPAGTEFPFRSKHYLTENIVARKIAMRVTTFTSGRYWLIEQLDVYGKKVIP